MIIDVPTTTFYYCDLLFSYTLANHVVTSVRKPYFCAEHIRHFLAYRVAVVVNTSLTPSVCRIDGSEAVYVVQTILPDIMAFVASIVTFTCCRALPLRCVVTPGGDGVDGVTVNHHASVASLTVRRNGTTLTPTQCRAIGVTLTVAVIAACGIVHPSLLNLLYFIATLVAATLWSLRIGSGVGGGRGLQQLRALLLLYTAAYLGLTYICQFPFAHQHLWVEGHLVIGGTVERYIDH